MQVSHTFRYLAVVGALIMASGQPTLADQWNRGHHVSTRAQVRHNFNTRRQIASRIDRTVNRAIRNQAARSRYRAKVNPYYGAAPLGMGFAAPMGVVVGSDPSGRINDALARGLISPQEADSLMQQYYDSIRNDQREGTGAYMANYDYVLNNLIKLRAGSLGR